MAIDKISITAVRIKKEDGCYNCHFWKEYEEQSGGGVCKRFPPRWWKNKEARRLFGVRCEQPATNKADWCGEWERRDD